MVPHAAGVGVASVLRQERSGLRTPLSKTWPWAHFTVLPKRLFLLPPPLRPRALALAPSPWLGFGGAPFVFLVFSPCCSRALFVVTLCRTALARAAVGTHFGSSHCGSIAQVRKSVVGSSPAVAGRKALTTNSSAVHSATPKHNKSLGVVAERVRLRSAEESDKHGDDEDANRSNGGRDPTSEK